ncbi:acyl-CoA dehydrogenase family protein [Nonomuraea sp. SYSU D8015]|uniref:acyl-CoA dehydrogenase family protein n=1 Tax=Nonomuraea sp. SYSU D8015 TaxID=2593644 RepID=UPI00166114E0|nr:acyl-CoA dehydrogenase family protein [Nonomuraea sp. SYSU D8015]
MAPRTANQQIIGRLQEPITTEGRVLHDLLTAHLPTIRAAAPDNDRHGTFPTEVFEGLRKDGVLGATVPRELGGLGVSCLHDVMFALLTVAGADGSTALALHMQLSRALTLTYDWQHGSAGASALAERLLRRMGTGEAIICTGVKDIVRDKVVTTLTPGEQGGWLLSGGKTLVSLAPVATHFMIFARLEGEDGRPHLATAVVGRDDPGLTVTDNWDGLGMRASGSVDVVFDRCRIAADDVFFRGPFDDQPPAALAGQTISSINMLGIYTGLAQAARDIAVSTLVRRRMPPAGGPATLVTEIDARLYSLRSTVAAAVAEIEELSGDTTGDMDERGHRMMLPFQLAKLTVNRLAPGIVADCMTLVGGASYSASHPLARLHRDVRAGAFMHPYTYGDAVDYLSGRALDISRDD